MLLVLQVVSVNRVAIAMALALAHALELPGKMRLPEEIYRAAQTTITGASLSAASARDWHFSRCRRWSFSRQREAPRSG
jgi:hypothetical protein